MYYNIQESGQNEPYIAQNETVNFFKFKLKIKNKILKKFLKFFFIYKQIKKIKK
jgi:hypothetical protein